MENGEWLFYAGHWEPAPVPAMVPAGPPPGYAEAPPSIITIKIGPPPPRRIEEIPRRPAGGYIWVEGDWIWNGNQYMWAPGRWEAPRPGWAWQPPHWQPAGGEMQWRPGHWRRHM
jgi:hypothetical protein